MLEVVALLREVKPVPRFDSRRSLDEATRPSGGKICSTGFNVLNSTDRSQTHEGCRLEQSEDGKRGGARKSFTKS